MRLVYKIKPDSREPLPENDGVRVLRIIDGRRDIAYLFGHE